MKQRTGYETELKYSKLSEKLQEEIQKHASMEKYLENEFGNSYAAAIDVNNTNYSEINKTYKTIFGLDKNMKLENKTDLGTDECIVKYKSVFKEDYNGNYYWYSTEPIEE